jgi:hypothetical protein
LRVGTARTDGDDTVLRLQHIAIAGDDQRGLAIGHRQHRLQPAQRTIGTPVLGQFDSRTHQIALMLVQLGLEALEQRKGIGRAASETGQNLPLVETPYFLRRPLDDDIAQRDLPVATHRHRIAATHRQDRSAVILLHIFPELRF